MSNVSRRSALGLGLSAGFSVTMLSGSSEEASAAPANTSFSLLLVNDIYKMAGDKGRGGFPRLAAIVKAERAKGVPMLFCHAGDTFSPSLMSGFDQGAHIVELTNLIKPDVFVPGNHEFDFGKDNYMKLHGSVEISLFRRQHAPGRRFADPRHEGRRDLHARAGEGRRDRACPRHDAADVPVGRS